MGRVKVVMPKLGLTMKKGEIVEWKKKPGEPVKKKEVIAVIQSEKLTGQVESPVDGVLGEILYDAGTEVPVGETIAIIYTEE